MSQDDAYYHIHQNDPMQEEISLADETFLTDVVLKLAQERSFQVIYGLLLPVNKAPC